MQRRVTLEGSGEAFNLVVVEHIAHDQEAILNVSLDVRSR